MFSDTQNLAEMTVDDIMARNPAAVSANPTRPATAIVHDAPGVRLVVFRIEPGQEVVPHTSEATVLLSVLAGRGTVTGGDESHLVGPGEVISYAPGELHGMRATDETFLLLATIIRFVRSLRLTAPPDHVGATAAQAQAQVVRPFTASSPSYAISGTIASAETGSAHHQPSHALSARPASSNSDR